MTTNKTVKRRRISKDKKDNKKKHASNTRRHRHKKSRKYLWKDYAYESNGIINNTTNNISNMDKTVNIVSGLRDYLALQNKEKIHK
jgi:sugar-specific transcriptional regulator TrmB